VFFDEIKNGSSRLCCVFIRYNMTTTRHRYILLYYYIVINVALSQHDTGTRDFTACERRRRRQQRITHRKRIMLLSWPITDRWPLESRRRVQTGAYVQIKWKRTYTDLVSRLSGGCSPNRRNRNEIQTSRTRTIRDSNRIATGNCSRDWNTNTSYSLAAGT